MALIHILALDATRAGGAGVYTWALVEKLVNRGHQVTLICHEASEEVKKIAKVIVFPRISGHRPFGMWRFSSWLQMRDYRLLLSKLQLDKPDAVIGSAQPMILPYARLFPSHRLIYLPHSLIAPVEVNSYPYNNRLQKAVSIAAYRFMEKKCLRISSVTVRFTENACAAFRNYYGGSSCGRMVSLPMPIDQSMFGKSGGPNRPFRLLSVGRLIKSKNIFFLLETLASMRNKSWTLDIVGSGSEMEALQEYSKSNGLDGRVIFHGHINDVTPFYRAADLFVFPSLLENSPVVLLEAMSFSLPTLSFYSDNKRYFGATHEIVQHMHTGLLATDNREFQKILANVFDEKINLAEIGAQACTYVREKHGWERHMENLEQIIKEVGEIT